MRASWDEGWSGKHVHSPGSDDDRNKETMTVQDATDERPLLYVQMDGAKFLVYRKQHVGFRR